MSDLRSKWRRSFLGALWSVIQPLGLTILLAIVLGKLFKTDIVSYAPYIFSGIIVWDCIAATAVGGSLAFVQADAYIKQTRHPLAIYTLRTTLANLVVLAMASLGLIAWVLLTFPENFGLCWIAAFAIFPLLGLICWPMATCLAFIGTLFRDLPHALGLILQALWFVSPIYFNAQLFRDNGLRGLADYNPIYHVLQLLRAPLLQGQWPTMENLTWCLATFAVLAALAWLIGRKAESKIIFHL